MYIKVEDACIGPQYAVGNRMNTSKTVAVLI